MIQTIKRVTFEEDIDLELFNRIKKFALKKVEFGEVKIYFPKEEYFNEDFDSISLNNSIILSLYYDDEKSYKRLVAGLMDCLDELNLDYDWDDTYFPYVSIIFDECINSDVFYKIINKKRQNLGYCRLLSTMKELNSDNLISATLTLVCQFRDFDKLLNQICREISEVNPSFQIIIY